MIPTLYVMVGVPGSGKSTFADEYLQGIYISRDAIRFSIINEYDKYFAKEDLVFTEFVKEIQNNIKLGKNVIADATHISGSSRRKLISAIGKLNYNIIFVVMATDFNTCIERNNKRINRLKVPLNAMQQMQAHFTYPNKEDFQNCKGVWIINGC